MTHWNSIEDVDPTGELEDVEQEELREGFEKVLAVIRAEFLAGQKKLTEHQVQTAQDLAHEALSLYWEEGKVEATISWVRFEMSLFAPRAPGKIVGRLRDTWRPPHRFHARAPA